MIKEKNTSKIRNFNWRVPTIVPSFIEGDSTPALYEAFVDDVNERFAGNKYLKVLQLVPAGKDNPAYVTGSNVFSATRLDSLVRPHNMHVASLAELSDPQILSMLKGKHYSNASALVVQSNKDWIEKNNGLLRQITELAENWAGKIQYPFMVTGFNFGLSQSNESYGLNIVPRNDFAVTHDKRLSNKNNGRRFYAVDKLGLPEFDKKGTRAFYAKDNGVSGLFIYLNTDLVANDVDGLASSYGNGRLVLVRGEAKPVK